MKLVIFRIILCVLMAFLTTADAQVSLPFPGPGITSIGTPSWVPCAATGPTCASVFADFTTEGTTNHYWYNGSEEGSAAAWYTAMGGTFTRGATTNGAWYTNSSKLLASAGTNVLRFVYNPTSGAANGIRIEAAATNSLLWSRDMSNLAWSASVVGLITAAQNATGADGVANSATTLTANTSPAQIGQLLGTLGSAARTYSAYLKCVTCTGTIKLTIDGTTLDSDVAGSLNTSTFTRVSISATTTITSPGINIANSGDSIIVDFNQLETGAATVAPTSPIMTTTVAVTRPADLLNIPLPFTNFNTSTGTVVAVGVSPIASPTAGNLWDFQTATAANSISSAITTSGAFTVITGGVTQAALTITGQNTATYAVNKIGVAWAVNDFVGIANNGTPATDTAGTIPNPPLTAFRPGYFAAAAGLINLSTWGYWPSRVSNTDIGTLTN